MIGICPYPAAYIMHRLAVALYLNVRRMFNCSVGGIACINNKRQLPTIIHKSRAGSAPGISNDEGHFLEGYVLS